MGFVTLVDLGQLTPTSMTLSAAPFPIPAGQPVTLTAIVTGANSGTVYFQQGTTVLGSAPLVNGIATLSNVVFANSNPQLLAIYSGDCNSASSQAALSGGGTATSMQLLSGANPSFVGQTVTFTGALTSANQQVPTGTVRFQDNGAPLGTVNIDAQGNAIFSTSALSLGNHQITAIYDGNGNFLGSQASLTQRVTQPVDLAIAKNVSSTVAQVGQPLTYTLQASNNSANDGTGVVVRDTLPANVTVNSIPAACTQSGSVVTCTIGNFPANLSAGFTIVVVPNGPGILTNTATISGNEADPVPGNNSASVATTIDAADLAITLADSPDPVGVGATLAYAIGVSNAGPSTANSVTVTFTRDPSLTFSSFNTSGLSGVACGGQTVITCSMASLASGANGTITFNFTTTATGTISASASISSSNPDPNTGNNSAGVTTTIGHLVDLAISVADSPDPVGVNGTINYAITVRNLGTETATLVNISGEIGVAAVFDTTVPPSGAACALAGISPTTFFCRNIPSISAGGSITLNLQAKGTGEGTATLSASVFGNDIDPNPGNNSTTETTVVFLPSADLSVTLSPSGPLQVSWNVHNAGPDPASTVGVRISFPPGLQPTTAPGCTIAGQLVICDRPIIPLAPNQDWSFPPIVFIQNGPVTGDITARAVATTFDPLPANNIATLPACAAEVTSSLIISPGGFRFVRFFGRYVQNVTINNSSADPIIGPLSLVLDDLSSNAALLNQNGVTSCAAPAASPYLTVDVGPDNVLTPGESASVLLQFGNLPNTSITYTTRVLVGANR